MAEPIAYRWRYKHSPRWTLRSTPVHGELVICEPLYASEENDELREIILALFNPLPDGHPKGCLANENGPCQCGYSEVAGKYLWALREAKKIAGKQYGKCKVESCARLKEPRDFVEAVSGPG